MLSLPWLDCSELPRSASPSRPSATRPTHTWAAGGGGSGDGGERCGAGRLLVEAHEALNVWYDGFIFDGVCDALTRMAVVDAR